MVPCVRPFFLKTKWNIYDYNKTHVLHRWMCLWRDSLPKHNPTHADAPLSLSRLPAFERRTVLVFHDRAERRFQPLARLVTFFSEAGGKTHRGFCQNCGSPIVVATDSQPQTVAVRTASLDDPSWFKQEMDVWISDAHPWEQMNSSMVKFEKYPH